MILKNCSLLFDLQHVSVTLVVRCRSCVIRSEVSVRVVQRWLVGAAIAVRPDSGVSRSVDPVNVTDCRRCVMNRPESV